MTSLIRVIGVCLMFGGILIVLLPLLWSAGFSEPTSLTFQAFAFFVGLTLGGWITGTGARLTWGKKVYYLGCFS